MGRRSAAWRVAAWVGLSLACAPAIAGAQYFGQNKVQYRTFDFQVLKTQHFDLYYYPEEAEVAGIVSRMAERWYTRYSRFFDHDLRSRQVVVLYAAPSHFRQTNVIEGLIGEGTGGVTEALKRRIVLPVAGSLADTDHVLGHELVHAFQFDMTGDDPRGNPGTAPGILAFPLWFVEGMAEYLSLGPVDAQTAMWLRDAALREKLPSVKDLDDPKYFPYRWGHAFWAFVGAKYGDRAVASLIRSAANPRFDLMGLARQLGSTPDQLDSQWHDAIIAATHLVAAGQSSLDSSSRMIVNRTTGSGRYNVGPRLSPDGRQVAFFSERDLFSIDLYIADTESGRIIHKLENSATDPHFDSLEFLDSAGAWSPDGRWLAITAVRSGRPVLALLDPKSGTIAREVPLPGLDDAINPTFSPDGRSVALSGNHGGLMDLYLLSLDSGRLDRLTHDPFADLEPAFTPDGKSLVFVTERFSTDLATLVSGPLRLARLDLGTHVVTPIPGFLQGKHLSPQVSADGRTLTFIAEPDGVSNLYRMGIDGGPIDQVSSFLTGVAGITTSSPALSSAAASGRLAFSVFEDDGQSIYLLDPSNIVTQVPPPAGGRAALLAGRTVPDGEVERYLTDAGRGLPPVSIKPESSPYKDHLSLDAIAQPSVGVGVSSFGGYVGGSIAFLFGDTLGDRALGVSATVNGTFADFGGQLFYVNRKHRWNWATSVAQVPYRSEFLTLTQSPTGTTLVNDVIERQTSRGVFGLAAYPLNRATRVEFSGGVSSLSFTQEVQTGTYDAFGTLQSRTVTKSTLADPINTGEGSVALVHDTSFFGATSPLYGERYRLELDRSVGTLNFSGLLIDWRRYVMPKRPITVAFRALHYGRYGADAEDPRLVPLYAGYPDLVHGYGFGTFTSADCVLLPNGTTQCGVFQSLEGSRIFVGNIEVRAPLYGLFKGDIQYGRIPVEIAGFFDAGVTWSSNTRPSFLGGTQDLLRSYGGAARVNVFGFLVLEVAASHPLDRLDSRWYWQVGLRQGF